jgi:hypothetical protein
METYLRCFVNACPRNWLQWLSLAEFWYNTSFHTSIGRSPFETLYGYSPRYFGIPVRMKAQADKERSEREFVVGDMVFLKLQPYIQSSLAPRANQMLSFNFFGPFEVLQRVGQVAYMLKLPPTSSIHPVFHVSQLKKAVGSKVQVVDALPAEASVFQVPEQILQRRLVSHGLCTIVQVLIKWSSWPESCYLGGLRSSATEVSTSNGLGTSLC